MTPTPFGQREYTTSQRRADYAAFGAFVRWTEEETMQLCETDARVLMQMATLRSSRHDLFVIRWCTARIRELQRLKD
jgi:hypothetical protein